MLVTAGTVPGLVTVAGLGTVAGLVTAPGPVLVPGLLHLDTHGLLLLTVSTEVVQSS